MRILTTWTLWLSLWWGVGDSFVPRKSLIYNPPSSSSSSSKLRDIPSSVNVDIPLPSWFVDTANELLTKFQTINILAADSSSSQLNGLLVSGSDNLLASLQSWSSLAAQQQQLQQLEIAKLALTPWHVETILAFGLGSLLLWFVTTPETFDDAPYEPGTETYDPIKANAFFEKRPLMVIKRILKLALLTGSFNSGLLFDWLVLGKLFKDEEYTALKKNEPRRAKVALNLCEKLGPTFIKL